MCGSKSERVKRAPSGFRDGLLKTMVPSAALNCTICKVAVLESSVKRHNIIPQRSCSLDCNLETCECQDGKTLVVTISTLPSQIPYR